MLFCCTVMFFAARNNLLCNTIKICLGGLFLEREHAHCGAQNYIKYCGCKKKTPGFLSFRWQKNYETSQYLRLRVNPTRTFDRCSRANIIAN